MLLYLNCKTFVGEAKDGNKLADEVMMAMAAKLPLIMVHDNDPARGGCDFGTIIRHTPADLIENGLYNMVAVAFHPEP